MWKKLDTLIDEKAIFCLSLNDPGIFPNRSLEKALITPKIFNHLMLAFKHLLSLHEFSKAERIYDTKIIQKLIWSISKGIIVARWLRFARIQYRPSYIAFQIIRNRIFSRERLVH